jgi:DNA polymerase-3 subunit gamma/tau
LRYLAFPPTPAAAGAARAAPLRAKSKAAISVPAPPRPAASDAKRPSPARTEPPWEEMAPRDAEAQARAVGQDDTTAPPQDNALGDRWADAARSLMEAGLVSGLVRELAWQSSLLGVDEGPPTVWRLCTAHEALRAPGLRDRLAASLAKMLGHPVVLELEAGTPADTPAQRDAAERQRRQREAEQAIQQDPVVRELMTQFETARIVPGSIKPV